MRKKIRYLKGIQKNAVFFDSESQKAYTKQQNSKRNFTKIAIQAKKNSSIVMFFKNLKSSQTRIPQNLNPDSQNKSKHIRKNMHQFR